MKRLFIGYLLLTIISSCKKDSPPTVLPTTVTTFRSSGLDVGWDQSGSDRIAYSSKGSDGYYDIHFANPDGSNDVCLTCNSPLCLINILHAHIGIHRANGC